MIYRRMLFTALPAAILVAGCSSGHPVPPLAGAELRAKTASRALNDTPHASKYRILHSFGSSTSGDGYWPGPGLINVNGTLYGTTNSGGKYPNGGTVYSITPTGPEKVVYSFNSTSGSGDGWSPGPASGLLDVNGVLYGTTTFGGKYSAPGPCTASVAPVPRKSCTVSTNRPAGGIFPRPA